MESAKPKVRTKPRERVANKERYAKKQRRKNAAKQLHQSMSISRKARAVVAKQGSAHAMKLSSGTNRNVLVILDDSPRYDRLLFKIDGFGNGAGTMLVLPMVNDDQIGAYLGVSPDWDDAIRTFALRELGVEAKTVVDGEKWLVLKGCKIVERKSDYMALNVKMYAKSDWWHMPGETEKKKKNFFSGAELKEYLVINGDISRMHTDYDTLRMIYDYRESVGKVKEM